MNILKTKISVVFKSLIVLALLCNFSCSSDDDSSGDSTPDVVFATLPSNALGDYTGELTYTTTGVPTANPDGTATITSTGDKVYSITFSDGVPSLTGQRFIMSEDGTSGNFTSADAQGEATDGISIEGNSLSIGITENGNSTGFSGSK